MKFVHYPNGKEQAYVFKNKKEQQQYVSICETIWGAVPCDVKWAIETIIYKTAVYELTNTC